MESKDIIPFKLAKLAKEQGVSLGSSNYYEYSLTEHVHEHDGTSGPFGWEKGELTLNRGYLENNNNMFDTSGEDWLVCEALTRDELHRWIRENRGVLIQVYNNASGYLWSLAKVPGGTDLGWSEFTGNDENSGTFKSYEDAYEDALQLVLRATLEEFRGNEEYGKHWGNYSKYLRYKFKQDK